MINEKALNLKARKKIIILLIIGVTLLLFDYAFATYSNGIPMFEDNKETYLIRPSAGESSSQMRLEVEVENDENTYSKNFDVTIDPYSNDKASNGEELEEEKSNEMSKDELIAYEVRDVINSLNDDTTHRRITLPSHLSTGEKVQWKNEKKSNSALIIFAIFALVILIYKNRLTPLKKIEKLRQQSIIRQLPEFVNRLVLLLNAGLVLNSAFEIASVENKSQNGISRDYFFSKMSEIQTKVKETNGSMNKEFREFAKAHRSFGGDTAKELMRISNIISDNISKGVELTDKLQRESETLWLNRKRDCEERGRLAETKLTLPLTIFLLVLVVITVSPALLEL